MKPAAKKHRISTNESHSILLECGPEIMRYVQSFLVLEDALEVGRTCRQIRDNTRLDVFRYSHLFDILHAPPSTIKYWHEETMVLTNLDHVDKLRAVLQNKSLPQYRILALLEHLVRWSKTDNGEAVSLLLTDGRCIVNVDMLDEALKKDFTAMAAELQQHESIKKEIQMCSTCSNNIGIYYCHRTDSCQHHEDAVTPKYCRSCALAGNRFCVKCEEYLCPDCYMVGNFWQCDKCQSFVCPNDECAQTIVICEGPECNRRKCRSCIVQDEETWIRPIADDGNEYCPSCLSYASDEATLGTN